MMKLKSIQSKKSRIFILLICVIATLIFWVMPTKQRGMSVSADSGDLIEVQSYTVEMTVQEDRWVKVTERIDVKFLDSQLTMFYRSLPTDGCRYKNFKASCEGNADFYYEVADNPDITGFIDVNCIGGVQRDKTLTYTITYAMQQGVERGNGMIIDVIGFGWSVPLNNVEAIVHFPAAVENDVKVYVGGYGDSNQGDYTLSADGKTLRIVADRLNVVYNGSYGEKMAEGITVDFALGEGVLQSYMETRIFTKYMGKLLIAAIACILVGVAIALLKQKREIITVVSIKPPEGMSPIQMGKILDGKVDNEDITSMIYYFAHKGYLKIDFTNEKDPALVRLVRELPLDAPQNERDLFEGLFEEGEYRMVTGENGISKEVFTVYVSELSGNFYETAELAKTQTQSLRPMYERKSCVFFGIGQMLGGVFAFLASFLMGRQLGGGYVYTWGALFFVPLLINLGFGIARENYRFKWKEGKRFAISLAEWGIALICSLIFIFLLAEHIMTEWEKLVLCIGAFLPAFLTQGVLVRTEQYGEMLGKVLGFKDFIIATEEDKIEYMLQENPELYYEVLPYAQVLGVTDEWEKKFAKLTVQPPTWYAGDMTVFDYVIMNQCFRSAMMRSMAESAKRAHGGGHIGHSGGGGGFGGFGGGGFGGGGGGAR